MPAHGSHRVESLVVTGLFDAFPVSIDLFGDPFEQPHDRLRIIFDDNGTGKTTVLRCLYHLMSWGDLDTHLAALARLPLNSATVSFADGAGQISFSRSSKDPARCMVEATAAQGTVPLNYDAGRVDPRARQRLILAPSDDYSQYQAIASSLCIPPVFVADDRTIHADDLFESSQLRRGRPAKAPSRPDSVEVAGRVSPSMELAMLFQELAHDFRKATLAPHRPGGESVYADVVKRIAAGAKVRATGDEVEAMQHRASAVREQLNLAAAYNLTSVRQLDEVLQILESLRKNHKNKKMIETVLHPFLTNLEAEAERLTPGVRRIDLFVSTANSFLREKAVSFSLSEGLIVSQWGAGSPQLRTSELSSGERHLLLLLGSAMISKHHQLIIIDEPELSLGIAWKRRLLEALLSLTEDSESGFLVASHSVEVISPFRASTRNLRATQEPA
jgi:hypothetical protein